MTLEKIISELHYTNRVKQDVLWKIRRDEKLIDELAKPAYQSDSLDFPLCKRMPLTRLSVVTYLLIRKYGEYKKAKIPDQVIFDTFGDVSLRAALYYKKTGKTGISKEDVIWFRHIMSVAIFKIGSLQFQPFKMIYLDEETIGEPYMSFMAEQKKALPAGSPVLNCHIQQGADLRPESVNLSFKMAKAFFAEYFPKEQYKAFLCYSWMLYPPMQMYLSGTSNIRQFAGSFRIIGDCSDSAQAKEFLFANGTRKEIAAKATSLQMLALTHPEKLGYACGIITI